MIIHAFTKPHAIVIPSSQSYIPSLQPHAHAVPSSNPSIQVTIY